MSEKYDYAMFFKNLFDFRDYGEFAEFFGHLFLHATMSFFMISIAWWLVIIPLGIGLFIELYNDSHWKGWDRDGKLDIAARTIGSLFPLVTLIWR